MNLRTLLCLLLWALIFVLPVYADSPVWKISKGENRLFLGGTVHILSEDDYPLPEAFEQAYGQSATLVLETDVQKLQAPEYQQVMIQKLAYSDGRTLKQVLNAETFAALEAFCAERGIPVVSLIHLKPGMVAMMLTIIELQRLGLVGTGVDDFYNQKSLKDGKPQAYLESVDAQLDFIAKLGDGRENELIAYSLQETGELADLFDKLKRAWRAGDIEGLEEFALSDLADEFPDIHDFMVVKRNNAWMPQIEEMLSTDDVELVLVGALHLVGEDGLLQLLAKKGYVIEGL